MAKVKCQTPNNIPVYDYKAAVLAAEAQNKIAWLPTEPKVEKDLHCIKTELTDSELHLVMTNLKLFTLYEIIAGNEYWNGRFKRMFPRIDFLRMGSSFGNCELNVHMPFYQKIDELLGLNTNEFYTEFTKDHVLKARMDFLDHIITQEDDLLSVGVFSMTEGSILYSSFASLMSFQANGKDKLTNMHAGLTFSVKDENLHSEGGAWAFRTLRKELEDQGKDTSYITEDLHEAAMAIYDHECKIIEMSFSKGDISGISPEEMRTFVKSRINVCLANLGVAELYAVGENPVAKWFYEMIGSEAQHDFFVKVGSGYNREYARTGFQWKWPKKILQWKWPKIL